MIRFSNWVSRSLLSAVVVLTILGPVVAGCGVTASRTPRASDEWSNGKVVGTAILNNPVALEVGDEGSIFLVWVGSDHALRFARLDESAETVVQRTLALRSDLAQKPQLAMDGEGRLHLVWLDKWEQNTQVFYARLSADGEVVQEALALTPPEQRATHSSMVLDSVARTVEIFWSDSVPSRPGCYHTALDWSGKVVRPPEMLIPDGLFPAAQMDRMGYVHLAWKVNAGTTPQFRYAVYDPESRTLGEDVVAGRPSIQMATLGGPTAGTQFDGPRLGLDDGSVYLAWVLQMRERERRDFTFYVAFPVPELPDRGATRLFRYTPPQVVDKAVRVQAGEPAVTGHPQFLDGQPTRQVLACFTQVSSPQSMDMLQIAAVEPLPDQIGRQEIVNLSRGASLRPSSARDARDQLHVVWIDTAGFERYNVVYASTSPQVRATLNRVTVYDVVDSVLSVVMSVITSLFFAPLALIWVLVPVVWLAVLSLGTNAVEVSDRHGVLGLAVAMLLQLGVKVLFFGDLLSRFPFTFLAAPSLNLLIGRWLCPVLLAAVSAGLVWLCLQRSRGRSVFAMYFLYAAIDSFLTLVIYVAVPMGW
ncbi:MAG: hypothetical protein R6X31_07365 [Anaerolineae bacterium]